MRSTWHKIPWEDGVPFCTYWNLNVKTSIGRLPSPFSVVFQLVLIHKLTECRSAVATPKKDQYKPG